MPGKTGFDVCQEVRADAAASAHDPDAHRQGARDRYRQGPGHGRRRLHDQALLDGELVPKVRELLARRRVTTGAAQAPGGGRLGAGTVVWLAAGRSLVWATFSSRRARSAVGGAGSRGLALVRSWRWLSPCRAASAPPASRLRRGPGAPAPEQRASGARERLVPACELAGLVIAEARALASAITRTGAPRARSCGSDVGAPGGRSKPDVELERNRLGRADVGADGRASWCATSTAGCCCTTSARG